MSAMLFVLARVTLHAVLLTNSFELRCTLCEALENGPVVIRVELLYKGRHQIETNDFFFMNTIRDNAIYTSPVPHWTVKPIRIGRRDGKPQLTIVSRATLEPNTRLVTYLYLHHKYETIPRGPFDITVGVVFTEPKVFKQFDIPLEELIPKDELDRIRKQPPFTIYLHTKIEGIIQAPTSQRLTELKDRLEKAFHDKDSTQDMKSHVFRTLCYAQLKELVILSLDLLKQCPEENSHAKNELLRHVYDWAKQSEEVRERLIHFLSRYGTAGDYFLFKKMQEDQWRLSYKELDVLSRSMQLPIRIFTHELVIKVDPERELPHSCQKEVLERELENLRKRLQDGKKP